jgi:hypothetical protein
MTTATEYRRLQDECLHWAANATSDDERSAFLQMAKTWYEAALTMEQSLGHVRDRGDTATYAGSRTCR